MVAKERPPGLRRRSLPSDHILGNRRLRDLVAKIQQFAVDARGTPQRVLLAHPPDKFAQIMADSRPSESTARFPAPVGPKPGSMPPQDRFRLNDLGQAQQAWP